MGTNTTKLRVVVTLAAALALAASGITGCSSSGGSEVTASSDLTPSPTPTPASSMPSAAEKTPVAPTPVAESDKPEDSAAVPPEEVSAGPMLTWTEFNPVEALGPGLGEFNRIESVGDGRVVFSTFGPSDNRVMVTENGMDWTEIPLPADNIIPGHIDIAGNRWLITGLILNSAESVGIPSDQVFFSDDQGATWTELAFSPDAPDGISGAIVAMAAGERMVVAAWYPPPRDHSEEESGGFVPSTAVFNRLGIFFSNGGPAELVAEYPSWNATGYATADGFHLTLFSEEEDVRLFSPDGRQWVEGSPGYEDLEGTAFSSGTSGLIWTTDPAYDQYRVERFPGVFGPAPVATLPDGISWVSDVAVGPAGVAAVAQPGTPLGAQLLPALRIEKDGYELRYNEPEGAITLWDLSRDAAVYEFGLDLFDEEMPVPEGTREVDVGDNGPDGLDLLVFEDPETGDDLVAFSREELFTQIMSALRSPTTDMAARLEQPGPEVGWWTGGGGWTWQTFSEAFGLTGLTAMESALTEVNLAVGGDFVVARVQTHEAGDVRTDSGEYSDAPPGEDGRSTSMSFSPQSLRWFIARAD